MTTRTGKSYERQVMRHLVLQRQSIAFELDARVPDTTGQYKRRIDVWIPNTREIVECKHYTSRMVGIEVVDRLLGTMQDVDAAVGHIFSNSGFAQDAPKRALKAGITCTTLPFATKFERLSPPTGGGYYIGDYIEICPGSATSGSIGDTWGRISYVDEHEDSTVLCTALSVDWGDVKAHRFIAYLMLVHALNRPPSDAAIEEVVHSYGYHFEAGQEWTIPEGEVWRFAVAEAF